MLTTRMSRRSLLKAGALGSASLAVPWRWLAGAPGAAAFSQSDKLRKFIQPLRNPVLGGIPLACTGHGPPAVVAAGGDSLHHRHRTVHRPAPPRPAEPDPPVGLRPGREPSGTSAASSRPSAARRCRSRSATTCRRPTSCRSIARSWAPSSRTTGRTSTSTGASCPGRATAARSPGGTPTTTRARASSTTRRSVSRTPRRTRPSTTTRTTRAPDSSGTTITRWARPG